MFPFFVRKLIRFCYYLQVTTMQLSNNDRNWSGNIRQDHINGHVSVNGDSRDSNKGMNTSNPSVTQMTDTQIPLYHTLCGRWERVWENGLPSKPYLAQTNQPMSGQDTESDVSWPITAWTINLVRRPFWKKIKNNAPRRNTKMGITTIFDLTFDQLRKTIFRKTVKS